MRIVDAAGTGATPAAFYLELCRLRGILPPPAPHDCAASGLFFCAATMALHRFPSLGLKSRIDAAFGLEGFFASIRKFGLEIKNRCTQEGLNREKLASIPKFGPEIKNRCTKEGVNREKFASIRKSGLEIKNRCTPRAKSREKPAVIPKFTPSNQESMHAQGQIPGKVCSDSQF